VRELRVGADGYLRKESDREAVLSRVREALRTRSRIEERLHGDDEVRGRLDGITVRSLLEFACRARKDARLAVRDATFLYEVEIRNGVPVRATRSSAQGGFARGAQVIAQLLGVGAGRFVLTNTTTAIESDLVGDLDEQLARPVALSRACASLLEGKNVRAVTKVVFDKEALDDYLQATPERAKALLNALHFGTSPEELVRAGECDLSLLEDLLHDVGARGVITRIDGTDGEDRLAPLVKDQLAMLDARSRGRIGGTPSPIAVSVKARSPKPPTTLGEVVLREGSDQSPVLPRVTSAEVDEVPDAEAHPQATLADDAATDTSDDAVTDVDDVVTATREPSTEVARWTPPKQLSSTWFSAGALIVLGVLAAMYASYTISKSRAEQTVDSVHESTSPRP